MRAFEIRTTDIISNDCVGSAPPTERHLCADVIVQEFQESQGGSREPLSKDKQSHTTTLKETHPQNHCTTPIDLSPSTPEQQHCSHDAPVTSTMQNTSSFASATTSNQGLCQVASSPVHTSSVADSHSQPCPFTPQNPHPLEAVAVPFTVAQTAFQPQSQAETQGSRETRLIPAHVVPISTTEPHTETPKYINPILDTTSAPESPTAAPSLHPQPITSSMEGSPVSDVPDSGFATLNRRLNLSGSDPHHPNHIQQHELQHQHYPGTESSAAKHTALDANKRPCYSDHTASSHPFSCCKYSTISIPLPHPPMPEKRQPFTQSGSPNNGVVTLRPAGGHRSPSTCTSQHHVTFSPIVGELATPADQNGKPCVETENENSVSMKFVLDRSRFWYKPGISRDQGITCY